MFQSIRFRLQFWLAILLLLVLSGFAATVYQLRRTNEIKQIDEELDKRVAAISGLLRGGPPRRREAPAPPFLGAPKASPGDQEFNRPPPPPPDGFPPPRRGERRERPPFAKGGPRDFAPRDFEIPPDQGNLFAPNPERAYYFVVWSRDGSLLKRSAEAPASTSLPTRSDRTDTRTHFRNLADNREAYHYTELGDCILAGVSLSAVDGELHRFAIGLAIAGLSILLLGLACGWWVTARAIRPIEQISAAAQRISAGNLEERIQVSDRRGELGQLAKVLNATFGRLATAFARQKQFTGDAAHELRTPLAVIISEAQTVLARPRDAAEYREAVEICLDAAQQMKHLTESLLRLARFDNEPMNGTQQRVDLAELCRISIERTASFTKERSVTIDSNLAAAEVVGDAALLQQLAANLLSNAIYYNKKGGTVGVSTRAETNQAVMEVTDTGIGIPNEELPYIFDRFYRVDKSRSAEEGRSGLGLAICQEIVERHRGSIAVTSAMDVGTTFTVRLPLASA